MPMQDHRLSPWPATLSLLAWFAGNLGVLWLWGELHAPPVVWWFLGLGVALGWAAGCAATRWVLTRCTR